MSMQGEIHFLLPCEERQDAGSHVFKYMDIDAAETHKMNNDKEDFRGVASGGESSADMEIKIGKNCTLARKSAGWTKEFKRISGGCMETTKTMG